MATTSGNNIVKPGRVLEAPRTAGVDFNQGDLVYSNSGVTTAAASDANCQYLIGVARVASPFDPTPYGTAVYPAYAEVDFGGIYAFKTTVGETFEHGIPVYIGADAQTVTSTAGANVYPVGKIDNPSGVNITGAAGVMVNIRIYNRTITGAAII